MARKGSLISRNLADLSPVLYTDDTQMSLATAWGCIEYGTNRKEEDPFDPALFVYHEYLRWLETQDDLSQRRAPGNTCLSALKSGRMGTVAQRINNSKGCGGAMRTAPQALHFLPVKHSNEGFFQQPFNLEENESQ